jgi:D-tyrosyl-tRNA(Tyr) deacylase
MRALLQRVRTSSVRVDGEVIGSIGPGLLVLLGIKCGDTKIEAEYLADKCMNLRIFSDQEDKFNLSAVQSNAEILIVSQFTLYGDCRKGRRPNFSDALPPREAEHLYDHFVSVIENYGLPTERGKFGAKMLVDIQNDGPVTVLVESKGG